VFENAQSVPLASAIQTPAWLHAAFSSSQEDLASLPLPQAAQLFGSGASFRGPARPEPSLVLLSQQFDGRWRLELAGRAASLPPKRAFGWAVGFSAPAGTAYEVRFQGQGTRTVELAALGFLWLAAAWITRRPARPISRRTPVPR
jgi:hypothetical protein